ncbi:unnamed protein product [Sphagnum balticum]
MSARLGFELHLPGCIAFSMTGLPEHDLECRHFPSDDFLVSEHLDQVSECFAALPFLMITDKIILVTGRYTYIYDKKGVEIHCLRIGLQLNFHPGFLYYVYFSLGPLLYLFVTGSYLTIEIGVSSTSFPVSSVWTRRNIVAPRHKHRTNGVGCEETGPTTPKLLDISQKGLLGVAIGSKIEI